MKPLVLSITAVIMLLAMPSKAQKVYFTVITFHDSRASISGFLHSVNDTAVILVPGQRKREVVKISYAIPVAVPIKAIDKMVTWRVRGNGTMLLEVAAIAAISTSTTFLAVTKIGPRWGLPSAFFTNMGIIFAHTSMITNRLSPKDYFFREKVEDRCIYLDERSLTASSSPKAEKYKTPFQLVTSQTR